MDKSKKKMLIVYAAGMTIIPVALSFVFDDLVLINFCVYLLLVYYTFKFFKTDIKDNLKQINKKMLLPFLKYELLFWLLSTVASSISNFFAGMSGNEESIREITTVNLGISILVFGIAGPLVEEIIFRFILLNYFGRNNMYKGIIVSALLFGILHLEELSIIVFLPYFLAGLFLGYVYNKEKNFIVSFGIHSIYNLLCLILFG